jgi:hypothetical protein
MDVWVAKISVGTEDESVIDVYSTEELAVSTASRVSPEDARRYVLDEIPDWFYGYEEDMLHRTSEKRFIPRQREPAHR